jgi:hypothetical protein
MKDESGSNSLDSSFILHRFHVRRGVLAVDGLEHGLELLLQIAQVYDDVDKFDLA